MAKEPKRISLALFDEELKTLINASAKIFPMSQEDIDNNHNPNNYEYAKVGRAIYAWHDGKWEYIIADDIEVLWTDIQGKPLTFPPANHEHSEEEITNLDKYSKSEVDNLLAAKADKNELHSHDNKSLLDTITQALINAWDSAVIHISDIVRHVTQADKDKWDTVVNKADKTYVDTALEDKADKAYVDIELNKKSPLGHDHDGAYYKKAEVDSKLSGKSNIGHKHTEADITDLDKYTKAEVDAKLASKSDVGHGHPELHEHVNKALLDKLIETSPGDSYDLSNLDYIEDIRKGYTEGHSHSNLSVLNTITQALVDGWNTVFDKADINHNHDTDYSPIGHNHDNRYYTETEVDDLLSGKSDIGHTHPDKADKTYVDSELSKKTDKTTTSYHINNTTVHVTQADKDYWNSKQDALGFTPVNKAGDEITGKLSVGNRVSHVPANEKLRSINLIDTDSVVRIWRYSSSGAGMEFINGTDSDPKSTNNAWWDIALRGTGNSSDMLFRSRVGGVSQIVLRLLPDGAIVMGRQTKSDDADDVVATKKYVDDKAGGVHIGTTKPTNGSLWLELI